MKVFTLIAVSLAIFMTGDVVAGKCCGKAPKEPKCCKQPKEPKCRKVRNSCCGEQHQQQYYCYTVCQPVGCAPGAYNPQPAQLPHYGHPPHATQLPAPAPFPGFPPQPSQLPAPVQPSRPVDPGFGVPAPINPPRPSQLPAPTPGPGQPTQLPAQQGPGR